MIKIGHRGAAGYAPENTLLSFSRAIELGVDVVELDVHCCKSGEVVVIHDDRVGKTTNGKGRVSKKNFDELRSLDAGQGEKIPLLEEALNLINRRAIINIELKGGETAQPVAQIIKSYITEKNWKINDFFVSSFNDVEILKFHEIRPDIKIGSLIRWSFFGVSINYPKLQNLGFDWISPSFKSVNGGLVDQAHKHGLRVFVRTVNRLKDIRWMKEMRVDGIFSDFPDRL